MNKLKAHTIYKINGKRVPGVTTIIGSQLGWNKFALIKWAGTEGLKGNDPSKVRDNAAEIGTLAHSLIHDHVNRILKGKDPTKTKNNIKWEEYCNNNIKYAKQAFIGFLKWEEKTKPIYKATEMLVTNRFYKYGGTLDLIAEIPTEEGTELAVVDFKTSDGFYPEMIIQLAAYAAAYEVENGPVGCSIEDVTMFKPLIQKHIILQIDKATGSYHEHIISKEAISKGWSVFVHLLALYKLQKELK